MQLVFVYGTLKKGCCNHHIMTQLKKAKHPLDSLPPVQVITKEKYPMYKSERYYPYLEDQMGIGEHISGELWEVEDTDLDRLDAFEGVPTLYKRGLIDVMYGNVLFPNVNVYFKTLNTDVSDKKLLSEWVEK